MTVAAAAAVAQLSAGEIQRLAQVRVASYGASVARDATCSCLKGWQRPNM